mgnify:CR=1 FL=1
MADLHVLELGSDPYERGLTHGRSMRKEIAENIDTYLARFAAGGLDAQTAREEGETWVGVMRDQNADYAEEMRGIADGAEVGADVGAAEHVVVVDVEVVLARHGIIDDRADARRPVVARRALDLDGEVGGRCKVMFGVRGPCPGVWMRDAIGRWGWGLGGLVTWWLCDHGDMV